MLARQTPMLARLTRQALSTTRGAAPNYPHFERRETRWNDNDGFKHVNNVIVLSARHVSRRALSTHSHPRAPRSSTRSLTTQSTHTFSRTALGTKRRVSLPKAAAGSSGRCPTHSPSRSVSALLGWAPLRARTILASSDCRYRRRISWRRPVARAPPPTRAVPASGRRGSWQRKAPSSMFTSVQMASRCRSLQRCEGCWRRSPPSIQ